MPTITRKFVSKKLSAGELSSSLEFAISHFTSNPESVTFKIMRSLADGSTEIRDDLTFANLGSICDLKTDFSFLRTRFEDSSKTDIDVEFSTLHLHDVFTVSVESKNEENIKTFFDLLTAKLKLESARSKPLFNEAITSSTKDELDELASRPYKYRHALLIKPGDIKYLEKFLVNTFEEVDYVARCIDDTKIPFPSVKEILDYENPSFKRITSLEIEARSKESSYTYLDLKIGSDSLSFRSTAEFFLMYKDINWGIKIEQELVNRISGLRPWYWWLRKIPFAISLPLIPFLLSTWLNSVSLVQKLRGTYIPRSQISSYELTSNEGFIFVVAVTIVLIAIGGIIDRAVGYLFPNVFFCLGKQADEFSRRQKIASLVFGGIVFTIILGIIANQLTTFIFG